MAYKFNPFTGTLDYYEAGNISSVSNSDGTLTISPNTGAVVASLNLANANAWTGQQTFQATTAATVGMIVKGFASQSVDLQRWQDSNNVVYLAVNLDTGQGGGVQVGPTSNVGARYGMEFWDGFGSKFLQIGTANSFINMISTGNSAARIRCDGAGFSMGQASASGASTTGFGMYNAGVFSWSSTGNWFDASDLGFKRNAAGVMEINDGSAGTYRDLIVRHLTAEGVTSTGATGTGSLVFATSPTLVTPNIGNATGIGLTVTAAFTINGTTNATVTMNRAATTNNALFAFQTAGVDKWSFGMRNDSTNDFHLRDAVNGVDVFKAVAGATPAVTSGASWILSLTKASNLTGNGFVKTSGGDGTLGVDTSVIAEEVAVIDNTGLTANVGATTLYSVGSSGAGMYRVSAYLVTTTAASVSSTMPNAQVVYTDKDSNASVMLDVSPVLGAAGLGQSGLLTANAAGTAFTGEVVIYVKASTTIQYQTVNYASTAAGMAYALHLVLEKL